MTIQEFRKFLSEAAPPPTLSVPLTALWWDAKGNWAKAHDLVDSLETTEAMSVHAYLHRKEGDASNAEYWYRKAGREFHRTKLDEEWEALVEGLPEQAPGDANRNS